jgi:hypothetical protein
MRRAITEWGLVVSLVPALALAIIGADSFSLRTLKEPMSLGTDMYLHVVDGTLCIHSDLGDDWKPTLYGVERQVRSSVREYWNWFAPGIEYHNRFLASGRTIWSLEVSLAIPVIILLIAIAILWYARRRSDRANRVIERDVRPSG